MRECPARRALPLALGLTLSAALAGAPAAPAAKSQFRTPRPAPPHSSRLDVPTAKLLAPGARAAETGGTEPPEPEPTVPSLLLPGSRVVSVYGAPQLSRTIVGQTSPRRAARRARKLARSYADEDVLPALPGIDLIAAIATADAGADGKYRFRQAPELIDSYLAAARAAGARLLLDIQPGRSTFRAEVKALRPWLREPDVDVALDPEWNVGRGGVPGLTDGSVRAANVNRISRVLARIVRDHELPQKLLVVHQFREGSVRKRSRLKQRGENVALLLNFDGIGGPAAKVAGYEALSVRDAYDGFSLFVELDSPLMDPDEVVALEPPPSYVMYQ